MKNFNVFCLLVFCTALASVCHAEENEQQESAFSFVTHGLLFRPLIADTFEPRVGMLAQFGKNNLELDIGNSIDLLQYKKENDSSALTLGADFFTFTLLSGQQHFHFPVDASDYFFGINFSYRDTLNAGILSSRLRLSHISAHFVDGHFDESSDIWKNNRTPRVYSREFVDLVVALEPAALKGAGRFYAGGTYAYHIDPDSLFRFAGYAGAEYHLELFNRLYSYIAYQGTLLRIFNTSLRSNFQAGIKAGNWNGHGINVFISYFNGYNIHGEYYDYKESYTGGGFLIEF
jgi:hypothetical protein